MAADLAHLQEPTLAVLAAISKEKGQEHYRIFENSVNIQKFKQYLQELRNLNGEDKIALFMDNLSAHRSEKSKAEMARLGFRCIFNVPYSPEFNPIEFVFSKVKQRFRALRARKMAGVIQDGHEAMVRQAVENVRKQDIVNCV
jgi:transposase